MQTTLSDIQGSERELSERNNPPVDTHLFSPNDDYERGTGRGEGPREQGSEERLGDRCVILEHREPPSHQAGETDPTIVRPCPVADCCVPTK